MGQTEQIRGDIVVKERWVVDILFEGGEEVLRQMCSQELSDISHLINKQFKFEDLAHFHFKSRQNIPNIFITSMNLPPFQYLIFYPLNQKFYLISIHIISLSLWTISENYKIDTITRKELHWQLFYNKISW